MSLPHWPTALWVVVGVLVLFVAYHLCFHRG